ncbi:hypothetical protein [Mycoplasma sp. 'Moose RK']|uniref:hypothetical protein n=1 Tax=Mycoplasma sp. 'Moose RK' TaxID=2780095 RepID=UPI0018C210B7|nr:hypothetical protein [Mycoplasma sp. 'Moose RK']MBG0730577.1 hypothetical protein [Mycoplasma sp. 'Moose RK']
MVATVGLMQEGFNGAEEFSHKFGNLEILYKILIIGGGSIIGLISVFIARYFFLKFFKKRDLHSDHKTHDHGDHIVNFSDVDNPKAAWLAILLLLSHRTIDGFILGSVVSRTTSGEPINWFLIGTFVAHMLIEVLIIHYRQVQYGQTIKKSVIYNLITTVILVPIIAIGAFANRFFISTGWLIPFFNISGGAILSFVVIIELVPEFIHLRNSSSSKWYISLVLFSVGIVFALILLTMHEHPSMEAAGDHHHHHNHSH